MSPREKRLAILGAAYAESITYTPGTEAREAADEVLFSALARAKQASVSDREAMDVLGGSRDWKRYKKMKDAARDWARENGETL